jgi:hypothetical protein
MRKIEVLISNQKFFFYFWYFSVNSKVVSNYFKPDILDRRLASLAWCTRRWRRRWGRCRSSPSNQGRRTTNGSVKKFNFMVKNKAKIFFLKYSEQIVFQKNIDLGKSCKTKFLFTVRIIFGLIAVRSKVCTIIKYPLHRKGRICRGLWSIILHELRWAK